MLPSKTIKAQSLEKPLRESKALTELYDTIAHLHEKPIMPMNRVVYDGILETKYGNYNLDEFISMCITVIMSDLSWLKDFNYITMTRVFAFAAKMIDGKRSGEAFMRYIDQVKDEYYRIYELGCWNSPKFLRDFFFNVRVNEFNRRYDDVDAKKEWLLMQYSDMIENYKVKWGMNMDRAIRHRIRKIISNEEV